MTKELHQLLHIKGIVNLFENINIILQFSIIRWQRYLVSGIPFREVI